MNKTIVTASSMTKWLSCQRAYYYRYVCGFIKTRESEALRFGSAWHRAMEARSRGKTEDECYAIAIIGTDMDEHVAGMLYGMFKAYCERYPVETAETTIHPEQEFLLPIAGNPHYVSAGKMDNVETDASGGILLREYKTTSDSVEPNSSYWNRLRFNIQMLNYVWACSILLKTPSHVIYDVVKKPAIRPKSIATLDGDGKKIVCAGGMRCYNKNGEPRQSTADESMILMTHIETPEEYATRVYEDIKSRPEYYFARTELCILDDDIKSFIAMRRTIIRSMSAAERMAKKYGAEAYPRNCSQVTCRGCDYEMFCMSNVIADPSQLPEGFELKRAHVELNCVQEAE